MAALIFLSLVGGLVCLVFGVVYRGAGREGEPMNSPLFAAWRVSGHVAVRLGQVLLAIGAVGLVMAIVLDAVR